MACTQAELDALKIARTKILDSIATGAGYLELEIRGRRVRYESTQQKVAALEALNQAISECEASLTTPTGGRAARNRMRLRR